MKNNKKRILSLVMAFAILASLSSVALATNGWTWGQEKAHEAADLIRDVGGNRYAANAALSSYWWSQSGRGTSNDFYYDSYANTSYYADGRMATGIPGYQQNQQQYCPQPQNNNTSNGIAFRYNSYLWYQTKDGNFYRWNGSTQVWASDSENDNILKNGTYQGRNYYDSYNNGSQQNTWYDGTYTWTLDTSSGRYYRHQNGTKVWRDNGQNNGSTLYEGGYTWYWDSSAGRYYRWNGNQKIWKDSNSNGNQTANWFDGTYSWWWDASTSRYYRFDNYGNKIWRDGNSGQNNGNTYYDGTYTWYWDSSAGRYYRWDGNQKIWKDNGTSGGGNQNGQNTNYSFYNYQNYYNGILTGTDNYVNKDEALILARIIYAYSRSEQSLMKQAAMGWVVLNYASGRTIANCTGAFSDYNPNSPTTDDFGRDLQLLARDILFRYQAEKAGVAQVGRVLPKEYTWIWSQGGTVYFRTSENGANYQFATSGTYRNPYNS